MNVQELKPTSKCNIIHLSIDVKFRLPMKPQVKKNLKQINKNTQKNADFINTFFYCRQKDSITLMFFLPHLAANYKKRWSLSDPIFHASLSPEHAPKRGRVIRVMILLLHCILHQHNGWEPRVQVIQSCPGSTLSSAREWCSALHCWNCMDILEITPSERQPR